MYVIIMGSRSAVLPVLSAIVPGADQHDVRGRHACCAVETSDQAPEMADPAPSLIINLKCSGSKQAAAAAVLGRTTAGVVLTEIGTEACLASMDPVANQLCMVTVLLSPGLFFPESFSCTRL